MSAFEPRCSGAKSDKCACVFTPEGILYLIPIGKSCPREKLFGYCDLPRFRDVLDGTMPISLV